MRECRGSIGMKTRSFSFDLTFDDLSTESTEQRGETDGPTKGKVETKDDT